MGLGRGLDALMSTTHRLCSCSLHMDTRLSCCRWPRPCCLRLPMPAPICLPAQCLGPSWDGLRGWAGQASDLGIGDEGVGWGRIHLSLVSEGWTVTSWLEGRRCAPCNVLVRCRALVQVCCLLPCACFTQGLSLIIEQCLEEPESTTLRAKHWCTRLGIGGYMGVDKRAAVGEVHESDIGLHRPATQSAMHLPRCLVALVAQLSTGPGHLSSM